MKKFWIIFWYILSLANAILAIWCFYTGDYMNNFGLWAIVCLLCANRDEQEIEIDELKEKMNKYE